MSTFFAYRKSKSTKFISEHMIKEDNYIKIKLLAIGQSEINQIWYMTLRNFSEFEVHFCESKDETLTEFTVQNC